MLGPSKRPIQFRRTWSNMTNIRLLTGQIERFVEHQFVEGLPQADIERPGVCGYSITYHACFSDMGTNLSTDIRWDSYILVANYIVLTRSTDFTQHASTTSSSKPFLLCPALPDAEALQN